MVKKFFAIAFLLLNTAPFAMADHLSVTELSKYRGTHGRGEFHCLVKAGGFGETMFQDWLNALAESFDSLIDYAAGNILGKDGQEMDLRNWGPRAKSKSGSHKEGLFDEGKIMKQSKKNSGWLDKKLSNPKFRKAFREEYEKVSIGEQLLKLRLEAGMTQAEVAKKVGTT